MLPPSRDSRLAPRREPFLLGSKNDGVTVAGRLGALEFGNAFEGNPEPGYCHAAGWSFRFDKGPEYLDGPLLGLFDRQAQRPCQATSGTTCRADDRAGRGDDDGGDDGGGDDAPYDDDDHDDGVRRHDDDGTQEDGDDDDEDGRRKR